MNLEARNEDEFIFVADGNCAKTWLGQVKEVVSLEVSGNYTTFAFANGQKLMVRGSLARWQEKLPDSIFFKTGKDCLINFHYVIEVRIHDSHRISFTLAGGREVIVSREQTKQFRKLRRL